ncbi:ATP-binding cassette sub-family A member 13-like [Hypanus sabinus]|uniref:ATP-binding cassette sub-family A member 13-like n=1 Tax=Hypanus sabinus TaxID=79690 RepID=UPI0028C46EDB|nr:ATP-binding cassette sub-family A member 13-like [Hypanus sabinus]
MARFIRQFLVLFWKNWLSRLRQPVLSLSEIIWPCLLFFILLGVRVQHSPHERDNCYLEPRNLPSGGLYPFVQSLFCDVGSKCQSTSFTEAGNIDQKSRLSLSLEEDGGSSLLSTIEELGKEVNATIHQAFSLQSKVNELIEQSGADGLTAMNGMDNIINIIAIIHNETYTWDVLFGLPHLVHVLMNEDFLSKGISTITEMLMNLKRLFESVKYFFPHENAYLALDTTFNLTISIMDIVRNVVNRGMKIDLILKDALWNAEEVQSILKKLFNLDPVIVEQLMNTSIPLLKFPILLNMNEFQSYIAEMVNIPFFIRSDTSGLLFQYINKMELFKQVFERLDLDEYFVTKFDQMLTAAARPLTFNQSSDVANSTQIVYLLSNVSWLIVKSKHNASSEEIQKYQHNLESLPQWPQLKCFLVKDKLFRDYTIEIITFEKDLFILLKKVYANLGLTDVDRIIMDVDILTSEIKMILTQNTTVTCNDVVLKLKGVLNLPEEPFLNDALTTMTCGHQEPSDPWNIAKYFPSTMRWFEAMETNVQPEFPVSVAETYKGWQEVLAAYESLSSFQTEFFESLITNMTMTYKFWENFELDTFQQHLLWNLAFDLFDAQGSVMESSEYWPDIKKYVSGICWVIESTNQPLIGNGSMCDETINWRYLFNETLIFIQNVQNNNGSCEEWFMKAALKFLNYQGTLKLSASDMQILSQSFGETSTTFANIQGLQTVVKIIMENTNLWINKLQTDDKTSSIIDALVDLSQINNANELFFKIKAFMNEWSKGLPSEFMEVFNILLNVLEKGVEEAIITNPFQGQINKFNAIWTNVQKLLLYNSTEATAKSLNFFWNFTSSVWIGSTKDSIDYVDVAKMFLHYLNNLGLLSQEELSFVVEAIISSKNISKIASTENLSHLQNMELQLFKVLETLAVENKTELLKMFYNVIQAVLKVSNETELSSVVAAFRNNSEDIFGFLEQFSSDDIGEALETVRKIVAVYHSMSREDLAENLLKLYLFAQSQIQGDITMIGPDQHQINETIAKLTEAFHNNTNNISCLLLQALKSASVPIPDLWLQQYCSLHYAGRKKRSLTTGFNSLESENLYSSLVENMIISLTYTNRDAAVSTLSCMADLFLLWLEIMKEVAVQMNLDFRVVSNLGTALMQMSEKLNRTSECTNHFIISNSTAALQIFLWKITSISGLNLQNLYQLKMNSLVILQQVMNSAFPFSIDSNKLYQLTEVMENMFSLFQGDNIYDWHRISKFLEALRPMWLLNGPQQEMFYSVLHAFANLDPSTDLGGIEMVFNEILSYYNRSDNMDQYVQNLKEFFNLMVTYQNSPDQFPYKDFVILMKQLIISENIATGEKEWGALLNWLNVLMQNDLPDLSLSFLSSITKVPIYRLNISEMDTMMKRTEEAIFQVLNLTEQFNGRASETYYHGIIALLEVMCPSSYPNKNKSIQVLRMSIELAYNIFNNENMSYVLIEELMKQIQNLRNGSATAEVIFGSLSKFISNNVTFQKWYSTFFTDSQTSLFKDKHNMLSILLSRLTQHFSTASENQITLPESMTDMIYNLTTTIQSIKDVYSIKEQMKQMLADLTQIIKGINGTENMDVLLTKLARVLKYMSEIQNINTVHDMRLILTEIGNENYHQTLAIIQDGTTLLQNLTTMNVSEALGAIHLFALAHQPDRLMLSKGNQVELNEKLVRLIQVLSASTNSSLTSQCLPVAVCSLLSEGKSNNSDPIFKVCNLEAKQNLSTVLNLVSEVKQCFNGTAHGSAEVECFGSTVSAEVIQQIGCVLQQYKEWNTVLISLSQIYGMQCPVAMKLQDIWDNFSHVIVSTNEDNLNCLTIPLRRANKLLALNGNKTLTNKTSIEQIITFLSDVRDIVLLMKDNKSESLHYTLSIITNYLKNAEKDLSLDFKKQVSTLIYSVQSLMSISEFKNEDLKLMLNDLLEVLNANIDVTDLVESLSTDINQILTDTMMKPEMKELLPAVEKVINFLRNMTTGDFIDLDLVQFSVALDDMEEILERIQQLSNLTGENHLKLLNVLRYFLKRKNTSQEDVAKFMQSAGLVCNISQLLMQQMNSNASAFDVYDDFLPYITTVLSDANVSQSSDALQLLNDFVQEVYLQSDLGVEYQQMLLKKAATILNQFLPMNNEIPINYTVVISKVWLEILEIDFNRKANDIEVRNKTLKLIKMLEEFIGGLQEYNPMKEAAAEVFKLVRLYLNITKVQEMDSAFTELEAICQFEWANKYLTLMKEDLFQLKLLNLFLEKMYFVNDIVCIQQFCGENFGGHLIHLMIDQYTFTADVMKILEEMNSSPVPEGCKNFVKYKKEIAIIQNKTHQAVSNALKNSICKCNLTQLLTDQLYDSLGALCQFDSLGNHLQLQNDNLFHLKFQNLYSEKLYFVNDIMCVQKTCKKNIAANVIHALTELVNFTTEIKEIVDETFSTTISGSCTDVFNYYRELQIASNQTNQAVDAAIRNYDCKCNLTSSLTNQLYDRFKYAVGSLGNLPSNNSIMIILDNIGTFQDLHLESCVQNFTTLKADLQKIKKFSLETIDALLKANISISELVIHALATADRCDETSLRLMFAFPKDVNISAVTAELCTLTFWDRYKLVLTISHNIDLRCIAYKAFLPMMMSPQANEIMKDILEVFSEITSLASKSLQFLELIPKLLDTVRNMNLPVIFEFDENVQTRSLGDSSSNPRDAIFEGICKTKSSSLFGDGLAFSKLPQIKELTEEDYIKYKIPTNTTPYCMDFYEDILKAPNGALLWTFLKPLLLGEVLFAPNTSEILTLMEKANRLLKTVENLTMYSKLWLKATDIFVEGNFMLNDLKEALQNRFVRNLIQSQLDTNVDQLLKTLQDYENVKDLAMKDPVAKQITVLSELMINVSSCILIKRFIPMKSEEDLEKRVHELMRENTFLASVLFDTEDSNTSRKVEQLSSSLPPQLKYTIRTNILHSMPTDLLQNPKWVSQPKKLPTDTSHYNLAFIPLQDMIERAIIEMQTGRDIFDPAIQVEAMPYPCHKNDQFLSNIGFFLPLLMMLAWLISIACFVRKLVFDKELRLEEYMKILGVKPLVHFLVWFLDNFITLIFSSAFITIILKASGILPNSDGFIVFLYFLDFGASVISLGYLIAAFFSHANTAALSACLLYIITFFPYMVLVVVQNQLSFSSQVLICLLCTTAFSQGAYIITLFEGEGKGLQWDNMYEAVGGAENVSFACICWMLVVDSLIYLILGWYLHNIFPGKYGTRRPWYFPFTGSYWMNLCSCAKKHDRKIGEGYWAENLNHYNQQMNAKGEPLNYINFHGKEEITNKLEIGVAVRSLTKVYKHNDKAAIKDLNLDFYKGEITALLGPNGAGKTTIMSMLTGLHQPTSGVVYVGGRNMNRDISDIREELGVCLQHDVLFDTLTVEEHLQLYGTIKAPEWTKEKLQKEVNMALEKAGIYQYQHKRVGTLSGGTKRKLSLAISFIGSSTTIILDEPTSGVDPCSRRNIWDIILKYREGRTIIFTTHHLDEADVLSDRIIILEGGQLKCCGSPTYLKEQYGHGYSLIISKKPSAEGSDESCDVGLVTSLVKEHIPQAFLKENAFGELTYIIPSAEDKTAFEKLLHALDENMEKLYLNSYSISDTTLEEVFLKLMQNEEQSEQHDDQDGQSLKSESTTFPENDTEALAEDPRLTGIRLTFTQMAAVMIKRFHHTRRDWKGAIANLLLPVLFVILAMALFSVKPISSEYPSLRMSPDLYKDSDATFFSSDKTDFQNLTSMLLKSLKINESCVDQDSDRNNPVCMWKGPSEPENSLVKCNCDHGYQQCPAINITVPYFRNNEGKLLYNLTGYNLENYFITTENAFRLNRLGGWSFGEELPEEMKGNNFNQIDINTLVKVWYNQRGFHAEPALLNQLNNLILWANLPPDANWAEYGIALYNHPYRGFLLNDDKILENLRQCGVAFCILLGFSILTASIGGYVVQDRITGQKRLQHISGLGYRLYWITNFLFDMICYLVPVVLCICVFAAFQFSAFTYRDNLGATALLLILFGFATMPWMYLLSRIFVSPDTAFITYTAINLVLGLCTILATYLPRFLGLLSNKAHLLNVYNVLRWAFIIFPQFCLSLGLIELSYNQLQFDLTQEFGIDSYVSPFKMDYLGWVFVAITLEGCSFFLIRLLFQGQLLHKLRFKDSTDDAADNGDEDVKQECQRVLNGEASNDVIQIHDLKKSYYILNKKVSAVKGITVGVPMGECFGLLGVNGAGKTTTFKILTGDVGPSSGRATIRTPAGTEQDIVGSSIDGTLIGYCPQFDALDELLTGWEHLYYYARIRGLPEKKIKKTIHDLAHRLHLALHIKKIVKTYSGGTKRKLSTALALIGKPQVILLDEPSTGMDPESKRFLWKVILSEVEAGCAAILTSHSMEECEALCTRLAIMVNGKFRCIGSPKHIKNRFGGVYSVKVALCQKSASAMELTELLMSHFPGTMLKEEHQHVLEYHVPQKKGDLTKMFRFLEDNKEQLEINHYSISQATLDQVFINFAHQLEEPLAEEAAEVDKRNPSV